MLVPSFFFGRFREVKAACARKITSLTRGAAWPELAAGEAMLDTRAFPESYLVIDGPSSLVGGQEHFHLFAMGQALRKAIPRRLPMSTMDTLFEPMIHTIWGFAAILGQWGQSFLFQPGHQERYLHLALRWWPELEAEGQRYTNGSNQGFLFWELYSNIKFCLARQGADHDLLRQPLPAGGLAELVALSRAGLPPGPDQLH